MATYINKDGLEVRFGASQGDRAGKAGVTRGAGKRRELVLTVDLVPLGASGTSFTADLNNDGTNDGFNQVSSALPIGAIVDQVRVIPVVAPVTTTGTWQVGTFKEDGTAVDDDGLVTTAGAAGAQIGSVVAAASGPWFVAVKTATAAFTAGKLKVIVEYLTV